MNDATQPLSDNFGRRYALTAGLALLGLALLAAVGYFGILLTLVVPGDAAATVANLTASNGQFRIAIAAFLVVIVLDVIVAWALYVLLRPVNSSLALLMAVFRIAFAAVFLAALWNLLDVARLLVDPSYVSSVSTEQLQAQTTASIGSFDNGWDLALVLFGLHLLFLGLLIARSSLLSKALAALLIVAGAGYLVDTFGVILVRDYSLSVSALTFVGEALLIAWLLWAGIKGTRTEPEVATDAGADTTPAQPARAAA